MTLMRKLPVAYAAPTELDLNSWDAFAINMTLLTELVLVPRGSQRDLGLFLVRPFHKPFPVLSKKRDFDRHWYGTCSRGMGLSVAICSVSRL